MPKELNFITGNRNKLAEVKEILGDTVTLKSQALDLTEIQGAIEDISLDKCRRAADIVELDTRLIYTYYVDSEDRSKAPSSLKTRVCALMPSKSCQVPTCTSVLYTKCIYNVCKVSDRSWT